MVEAAARACPRSVVLCAFTSDGVGAYPTGTATPADIGGQS